MPTKPVTTKSFVSAYVNGSSGNTSKNFSSSDRIAIRSGGGVGEVRGLLYCALPGPLKAVYTGCTLTLTAATAIPAGRTIYVARITTPKWAAGTVKWSGQPTFTNTNRASFVTTTTIPVGGKINFNVTALMQDASNSGIWGGFSITVAGESSARYIYNQRGKASGVPVLTSNWSDSPLKPTALVPSENRSVSLAKPVLSCNHVDVSGNTALAAIQVQIDDAADFLTPLWTSAEVATTSPQLDLATTDYPGINEGETRYWRVRLKDGAGLWSPYSAAASFKRTAKPTLVINSPSGASVTDPSQTIVWTLTGGTQRVRQVVVRELDTFKLLWDSGRITTTENDYTLPSVFKVLNRKYWIAVLVWDTVDRANTVGDLGYVQATVEVTFALGAALTPFAATSYTPDPEGRPWGVFTATRANAPDRIGLFRDGKLAQTFDGADAFVSGTTYQVIDRFADPRKSHTWNMVAIENNSSSAKGPDVTTAIKPLTAWLCSESGEFSIPLTNYTNGLTLAEDSSKFTVLGSEETINVYSALRGWEGSFSGVMTRAVGGRTSDQYRIELLKIRDNEGMPMILTWADHSIRCVVNDVTYSTVVTNEEILYAASFTVGERNRPDL